MKFEDAHVYTADENLNDIGGDAVAYTNVWKVLVHSCGRFPGIVTQWSLRKREMSLRKYFDVSRPSVEEEFPEEAA